MWCWGVNNVVFDVNNVVLDVNKDVNNVALSKVLMLH